MATTLIVDGYNAINAIPETRKEILEGSLEKARKIIVAICKEYARSSGHITDVRVVFDGDDKYRGLGQMEIPRGKEEVFSRTGEGDDKIIDTVKKYSSFSRVIVASNDNYVRNMSRGCGASLIDVKELVSNKKRSRKQQKDTSKHISPALEDEITQEYRDELGL